MIKTVANLPFRVLGRAARAVQDREKRKRAEREHSRPDPDAETRSANDNIPGFDVPDDWDAGDFGRKARVVKGWLTTDQTVHFVDVREKRTLAIPGAQHIPLDKLGIELADLPPAGHPIVVYCGDGTASERATRFLRFRGIEDAVVLTGGLSAWQSAKGPVEPVREI